MTQLVKYAVEDVSAKHDQAQALVRIVAREWVGHPASEIYRQLEKQGWVWRGDGWYVRVETVQGE